MSANIRALIEEKNKDKAHNKKIMLKDINHDLIIALLAYNKFEVNKQI